MSRAFFDGDFMMAYGQGYLMQNGFLNSTTSRAVIQLTIYLDMKLPAF